MSSLARWVAVKPSGLTSRSSVAVTLYSDILFNSINGSSTLDAAHVKDLVARAGVGVDPKCAIPRRGHDGSLGNVGKLSGCAGRFCEARDA